MSVCVSVCGGSSVSGVGGAWVLLLCVVLSTGRGSIKIKIKKIKKKKKPFLIEKKNRCCCVCQMMCVPCSKSYCVVPFKRIFKILCCVV